MKVFLLCAIVVLVAAVQLASATDYCSSSVCSGSNHVACNNKGSYAAGCSGDAQIQPMTESLKQVILNKHNSVRNTLARGAESGFSPAARMATLVWDDELAYFAELNVKQCTVKHDSCRNTDDYKWAGQNLAMSGWGGVTKSVESETESHIQMWYNEYKDTSMSQMNSYPANTNGKTIGHYTQMVQDKAVAVGCAVLRETKGTMIYQYTACDYARTNMVNWPVYTSGTAASKCTTGTNPNFSALCSVREAIDPSSWN